MKFRGLGESRELAQGLYRQVYILMYTVYRPVYTGIYRYILYRRIYTCIYQYILCTESTTDWYIPVYTFIYFHCEVAVTQGLSQRRRALKCETSLLTTRLSPRESPWDLPRDCTDMYIPVYTMYRLVYTGMYWYILRILRYRLVQELYRLVYTGIDYIQTGIYRYIQVYTQIYCYAQDFVDHIVMP